MGTRRLKFAIILGLLTAVGPLSVDMYLPALPTIATDLGAPSSGAQWTVMAFFLAMGLSQIVYGPASDIVGRKPPIYFGLCLFIVGSSICFFAPNISWLIAGRILQGVGAAAPMVVSRAVVRDLHTGIEATRLMAMIMLVFSVCPLLAPLIGSSLIGPFGWRAVFVMVGIIALMAMTLTFMGLPETKKGTRNRGGNFAKSIHGLKSLLSDRYFLGTVTIGSFGLATVYVFVAASPFVYLGQYGLSSIEYSIAFAVNAISWITSSQFAATIGRRVGLRSMVIRACTLYAITTVCLCGLVYCGIDSFFVVAIGMFIANALLGLVMSPAMVLALEKHGDVAGMASALAGMLHTITAGCIAALGTLIYNGHALPMLMMIAGCGVLTAFVSAVTLAGQNKMAGSI